MAPFARSGWHRAKASIADEVAESMRGALADSAEREAEMLRQMSDLFSEIGRLSVDLGAVWRAVDQIRTQLQQLLDRLPGDIADLPGDIADLREVVNMQIDVENQSTEVMGRVLQSARTRLDALEEAAQSGM